MIISRKKYEEALEAARREGAERAWQEMRVQKMSDKLNELEAKQSCANNANWKSAAPEPRPCPCRCGR